MAARYLVSGGIYTIRNIINNKIYIGSAVYFKKRWNTHLHKLRLNKHHSRKLQNAWNKYGEESFSFEIIENIENKTKLIEREQVWLNFFKPEYNIAIIAGSSLGIKRTNETKAKLSALYEGKSFSIETQFKKGIVAHNKGKKGFKQSNEFKQHKIEEAKNTWSNRTEEERKEIGSKIRESKKGKPLSEETKEKIRQTMLLKKGGLNGSTISC